MHSNQARFGQLQASSTVASHMETVTCTDRLFLGRRLDVLCFFAVLFDTQTLISQTTARRSAKSIKEVWSWAELVKFAQTFHP